MYPECLVIPTKEKWFGVTTLSHNYGFHFHEKIAIMGQSGAGKTTLLNTLAQRVSGKLVGEVRVNGKLATKNVLKKNVGYVHQHV